MGVGDGVAVAGGADPGFSDAGGLPFTEPGLSQTPVGRNPVTAGNRSGQQAITGRAMDKLLAAGVASDLSATKGRAPTALAMAGVLSEPTFQVVMRALSRTKGIDFLNAPTVVTRSGLPARIEVVREFLYPAEYDPPEIPNEVGLGNAGGLVTPSTPTAFELKPVGSILEVEPVVSGDGKLVEVNLDTLHREFLGFVNYGSPIRAMQSGAGIRPDSATTVTENRVLQPVFETRHLKSSTSVYDGQTLVIGGLMHENLERVDDKVPLLGDLPVLGRFFKSKAGDSQKRVLLIFLKVDALDPAGKPMRESLQAGPVEP
jgi:general secretion pathway protein D